MSVTTSYTLAFVRNLNLSPSSANVPPAMTELANGGFVSLYDGFPFSSGYIYNSLGQESLDIEFPIDNPAIDQLTNGNLVVVDQDSNSIVIRIFDSTTGDIIGSAIDLNDTDSSNADVAALTGGRFVVVATDEIGAVGGDSDIDVYIRNADGSQAVANFSIDTSLERDINPRVAALDNGNFAVTWQRDVSGQSEIWYAVYDPTGATIKAPTILDTTGSINRNPDISVMNGGFGIVYEDTDWDADVDITLARFSTAGTFLDWTLVSTGAEVTDDGTPTISRLSNGLLAVAFNVYAGPVNSVDTRVALLDAGGASVLASRYVTGGESSFDNVGNVALTGFGAGRIAVTHNNITEDAMNGEVLSAVRVWTSDSASDTITGDAMDDWMYGNDGNDILNGMGGDDQLNGGIGVNTLSGGDGNDTLVVQFGSDGSHILGGNGIDRLIAIGSVFTLGTISSIEEILVFDLYALRLTGSQFATGLAASTAINGNDSSLIVDMSAEVAFISKFMTKNGNVSVTVNGTTGSDVLKLGNFTHTVNAGDGADQIKGGTAVDFLNGGADVDKINGAAGADILSGGTGNDVFKYAAAIDSGLGAAADRITDYAIGGDRLNFSRIDTNAGVAGDQAFGFIGTASFGGIGVAQIRYLNSGADLLVQADVDGNGTADMEIILQGLAGGTLTAADFVL